MSALRTENLLVERRGVTVVLTIDRAERFNTLSVETLDELDVALCEIVSDENLAAIVLTGAGGVSFAAGADISEFAALSPAEAIAFSARGRRVMNRLARAPQVVIAAIDGYCMGGGLDLALACDVRYASPHSVFAHPGAKLGILTGFGGTARLPRLVGRARAIELFATARRISATEARAMGLVDRLAAEPLAAALATASRVGQMRNEGLEFDRVSPNRW